MKKIKYYIVPIFVIILLFAACDDDNEEQTLDATITIQSPTPGQVFEQGDTVHIAAAITAAQELHGWEIVIRKKADNAVVYSEDKHTHGEALQIKKHWVNNATAHTDLILEVTAALDHSAKNLKTATVSFHCHPN
ncbi:MAG: hypothetical protein ACK4TA_04295 [Saprospiraceae bacterium]